MEVHPPDDVAHPVFIDVAGVPSPVSLDPVELEEVSRCFFRVVHVAGGYRLAGDDDFTVNVWLGHFLAIVPDGSGDVGLVVADRQALGRSNHFLGDFHAGNGDGRFGWPVSVKDMGVREVCKQALGRRNGQFFPAEEEVLEFRHLLLVEVRGQQEHVDKGRGRNVNRNA